VHLADLTGLQAGLRSIEMEPFAVNLGLRDIAVTECADVVLLVAVVAEKAGASVDWEGVTMRSVWHRESWRWVRARRLDTRTEPPVGGLRLRHRAELASGLGVGQHRATADASVRGAGGICRRRSGPRPRPWRCSRFHRSVCRTTAAVAQALTQEPPPGWS
jgi:hypothetical protein